MYARKTVIFLGLLLPMTGTIQGVSAAEEFDPVARAKTIAPYLDAGTIAVLRIDLARIEVDQLLDKFLELVPGADYQVNQSRAALVGSHAALIEAGIAEIYMVVSLTDLPKDLPFFILPITERSDVRAASEACSKLRALQNDRKAKQLIQRLDNALFVGGSRAHQRIKLGRPHPRPELAAAFLAAGNTAVQGLLLPTADHRRVVDELLPTLPKEVGGGPSTILTRGLLWAALGVNTPPDLSLQITIQSADYQAARALAEHAKAVGVLRKVDQAVAALTPKVDGDRAILTLDEDSRAIETFLAAIAPPIEDARIELARKVGVRNLKHLALAMHNHYDAYKSFPAQANFDAAGKPLLSWRVHILPFVSAKKLYEQFHLDEPWDSPHNRELIAQMPDTYRSPLSKKARDGYTSYVMPAHERTVCPGRRGITFKEITDGTSNTIMIVEVGDDQAVIWTKPEDLPVDLENPARGLGGLFKEGFQFAMSDGSVQFISHSIDPNTLRRLLMRNDGEPVGKY